MLSPRWKKVIRDLWGNKTRTLLAVIAIAVGVAAIGTISSAQVIITRDLGTAYVRIKPPAAIIASEPFDDELVDAVRAMPEVAEAEGRRRLAVRVQTGPDQWQSVELFAVKDFAEQEVDLILPQQGAWPPPKKQVLIERNSLGLIKAAVGDTILIETPDGKQREMRIAGTTHHLLRPPAQFTGTGSGYITFDTMEWLGEPRDYDQLRFTLTEHADDQAHARTVAEKVRDKIEKGGYEVYNTFVPVPGRHPANDAIEPILLLLNVLGYLTLFLSGFLMVNTISSLLGQQVRQIGVMKSIGATGSTIFGLYLTMVVLLGLLALVVAVPVAAVGAYGLATFVASIANFDVISFPIPLEILALEIAAALLVPSLAALLPIRSGTRITIREAISGSGEQVAHGVSSGWHFLMLLWGPVAQGWAWLMQHLALPRPLILSLRNSVRRRGRLALTLSVLTLGGGIFIAVFTVRVSLLRTFDDAIAFRNYDVQMELERPYRQTRITQAALEVPEVVAAESWGFAAIRRLRPDDTNSDTIQLYGVPAQTRLLRPVLLAGRWLRPDDERALVVNTDLTNDEPDIRVGDTITLKLSDREVDWKVVGLVQGVLAGPFAFANYPTFAYETRNANLAGRLQLVTAHHDPATQLRVGQELEEAFKRAGIDVNQIKTTTQIRGETEARFAIIVVFLFIMAALIALVGGLGLMGTMSMNVLERTREIGVMRAIGATDGAILLIVIAEGVLVGIVSWAMGAVLSYPLSQVLSSAVGYSLLESPLNYRFAIEAVAYWLIAAIAIAALASMVPAWRAARLSIRDTLAYE